MIETAIVILNYNGSRYLRQFLPSVINYSTTATIIVADNGSTDDSLAVLQKFPTVNVIEIGQNLGFCGGYNFALQKIEAQYYVLLNSDIEVTEGWVTPVIDLLNSDTTIAAVQPKIRSYHHRYLFEYAGACGGFIDFLGYPFCRGRIFDHVEEDHGQYNDAIQVFWATGACLFIRSERFHEAGGLDDDFFAHMEEIDLCWRLNRMGHKVYVEPKSVIYHVGGGTLSKSNPRKTYLNFRNGLSLLLKNLTNTELAWRLPLRMVLDWIASLKFLFAGQFKDAGMVWKAHFDFLMRFRNDLNKRKRWTSSFNNSKNLLISNGILAVEYYMKGKKTFPRIKF